MALKLNENLKDIIPTDKTQTGCGPSKKALYQTQIRKAFEVNKTNWLLPSR